MNGTIKTRNCLFNKTGSLPLFSACLAKIGLRKHADMGFNGVGREGWIHQNLRLWAVLWAAILLFSGCGGSAGQRALAPSRDPGVRPDVAAVAALSSVDCSRSPVLGNWRQVTPFQDLIVIGKDCLFETQLCGVLGYIDSAVDTDLGIADVEFVWVGSTSPACPPPGRYRCAYDARLIAYREIVVDCR